MRDDSGVQIDFRPMPTPALPPASELLAAMVAEMGELYGDIEGDRTCPAPRRRTSRRPRGAFLVGFHDGEPVCAGGIKRIAPDAAEIKRMYVVPDARRPRRRARAAARARGRRPRARLRVRAPRHRAAAARRQDALRVARATREIGNFNANPIAAYWGEKAL